MLALAALIALYVDARLVAGSPKYGFWFADYIEEARRLGTAQSSANLAAQSDLYKTGRPIESVLFSPDYARQTDLAVIDSYNHWKGLSDDAKVQLNNIITAAVKNGTPPEQVAKEIEQRLAVTASKAKRITDTDIPNALREAKLLEAEGAAKALGVKIKYLWVSALTPTTRSWHASRHGRLYTMADIKAFYATGSNKFNCKCSFTEVILSEGGEAKYSETVRARMAMQRKDWQTEYE
jgi:SPP1 gp7 family putative phage head morphogenesis protein